MPISNRGKSKEKQWKHNIDKENIYTIIKVKKQAVIMICSLLSDKFIILLVYLEGCKLYRFQPVLFFSIKKHTQRCGFGRICIDKGGDNEYRSYTGI